MGLPAGAEALEKEGSADELSEKAETTEEPAALNDANEASLLTTSRLAVRESAACLFFQILRKGASKKITLLKKISSNCNQDTHSCLQAQEPTQAPPPETSPSRTRAEEEEITREYANFFRDPASTQLLHKPA